MLRQLTVAQFLDERDTLPDGGQWAELVEGVPICLAAPDVDYGNTVLNLSKALADYIHRTGQGYACFDLPLLLARGPDTLLKPAVSYFVTGERFAECDKPYTETRPALVVEIASTSDRREQAAQRAARYLAAGIDAVWTIDPAARTVTAAARNSELCILSEEGNLAEAAPLPDFTLPVPALFALPAWWQK